MLYIVATPIGNLGEITYRAVEVLQQVDAVLCEDTRHTRVLLDRYDIKKSLVSYQKFNEREKADYIVGRLKAGENLSLVSDAGMPIISDPGKVLLEEVIKEGLDYTVISGPCALINAIVLSGMDASAFCMMGFLPEKTVDKKRHLARFKELTATLVMYVPPHDARQTLEFLYSELGARKVALVREISKLHEEVVRGTLGEFPGFTEKGEFVLVIEGAKEKSNELNELTIVQHVDSYINSGLDKKDAMKRTAADRKVSKSEIYATYEREKDGKR